MEAFEFATDTVDLHLDYHLVGRGQPVVMLHARPFVSWYTPLADALPGWSILRYHRTVRTGGAEFRIEDDAAAVAALLRHVGFDRAHVVGHSYGGLVALALAIHDGSTVRSLGLLEPAGTGFLPRSEAEAAMAPTLATYRAHGAEAGIDQFLALVAGDRYRPVLDRAAPGAFDDAVAHAAQFFDVEWPAVAQWVCAADDVAPIAQPVLNVIGGDSSIRFSRVADLIQGWLPHAVRQTINGTNHLLIADQPRAVAACLETFWNSLGPS